jgi:hypothetical protein
MFEFFFFLPPIFEILLVVLIFFSPIPLMNNILVEEDEFKSSL